MKSKEEAVLMREWMVWLFDGTLWESMWIPLFLIPDDYPALKPSCSSTPSLPSPAILARHQVKHFRWKCRGNQTILVDGLLVEVFWDVHNWLFGTVLGSAVFIFQTCVADEKLWASHGNTHTEPLPTILPWFSSQIFRDSQRPGLGFSLILYAWKNE
ncbi:hypothetical protein NE237_013055 [Protea cynaroides]|uniref:Uncharacterized protein n=1 Tax=Protea cynaroides TaxID=273540 RepID=A0A9Q0GXX5_9MAGN|nr:hypothetical protein NE237_013055 [Protea cynaroides]